MMRDTTAAAAEVQRRVLRGLSMARKAQLLDDLCETTRAIALVGIRSRHPEYDDRDARWALWRSLYGDVLFRSAWPDAPLLAP